MPYKTRNIVLQNKRRFHHWRRRHCRTACAILQQQENKQRASFCFLLFFLLFAICFLLFAFRQATCFFLVWSPSNASSFLHLQLNQETGAGKEPKNSVVLNCFLIPDEDEIFFQINGKGKVIIHLVHLFPSFHSPEILISFYSNQH